jgi:hypothetical protein
MSNKYIASYNLYYKDGIVEHKQIQIPDVETLEEARKFMNLHGWPELPSDVWKIDMSIGKGTI